MKVKTPPTLNATATPKKLTDKQKSVVEKLINRRFTILARVASVAPIPDAVKTGPYVSRIVRDEDAEELKGVPSELLAAYKTMKAANNAYCNIQSKIEEKNKKNRDVHHTRRERIRVNLLNERDASIARLHLENSSDEVNQYLDRLPSVESILPDLRAIGIQDGQIEQLLLEAESTVK